MALASAFTIHRLGPGASREAIQPVLDLSNRIFDTASLPPSHHSSLDEWHRRLSLHSPTGGVSSILVYATTSAKESPRLNSNGHVEQNESGPGTPFASGSENKPAASSSNTRSTTTQDTSSLSSKSTSTADHGPVGFIFASPQKYASLPYPTLHIWLAGVPDWARGTGVFAALMDEVEKHARGDSEGEGGGRQAKLPALSVCTFPARFPRMFAILQKQGWEVKEWMDEGKVFLVKQLQGGS